MILTTQPIQHLILTFTLSFLPFVLLLCIHMSFRVGPSLTSHSYHLVGVTFLPCHSVSGFPNTLEMDLASFFPIVVDSEPVIFIIHVANLDRAGADVVPGIEGIFVIGLEGDLVVFEILDCDHEYIVPLGGLSGTFHLFCAHLLLAAFDSHPRIH